MQRPTTFSLFQGSRVCPDEEGTETTGDYRDLTPADEEAEFVPMRRELKHSFASLVRELQLEAEFVPMRRELKRGKPGLPRGARHAKQSSSR